MECAELRRDFFDDTLPVPAALDCDPWESVFFRRPIPVALRVPSAVLLVFFGGDAGPLDCDCVVLLPAGVGVDVDALFLPRGPKTSDISRLANGR